MTMNKKMMARQHLLDEMERVKSQVKLTPEERRKEVRRQMYVALKAMEMERRQRVALEDMEKCKRDREERERVAESLRRKREKVEEERMRQEVLEKQKQEQLKKEKLQWESVMMVEEEDVKRPRYTGSALKKEPERKGEELCHVPTVGDKAQPESLTSDLKSAELKKETLYNNWVGEEKVQPNSSVYRLFAAKPGPKPEEKTKTTDHREKKSEKHKVKVEEQYTRWSSYKSSHMSQFSQLNDCYTGGFATSRNSILKSTF
ncbi:reticulocyte-binding protein homolog 2a-like [Centropristis striata]|uniref:reticulocyte-binding protein homolog 2a-like n=1 Tax=Centropristis striata TaxID=184440 RepID=UPI0027DF2392|nr:reticulocyte-binding protein homolog 2a-like [Centropristis striata]